MDSKSYARIIEPSFIPFAFLAKFILLINDLKNILQNLRIESTQFNANDVLVNIDPTNPNLVFVEGDFVFSLTEFPKRILSETNKMLKESGVNALCSVSEVVEIKLGEKKILTPITLFPLEYKINKQKQQITFLKIEDEQFVNPFLIIHIEQTLGINLPNELAELPAFLLQNDFDVQQIEKEVIGNFHHHRYQIIKELDEILELKEASSTLKNLLGFGSADVTAELKLIPDNLFFADIDHEKVFDSINNADIVVQGPPGTGKSQVLSNILGKLVAQNKTTIVVSEKKAALDVIKKKLGDFKLDQLCFIATSDHLSHTFFSELKASWNYFEDFRTTHSTNIRLSEQCIAQLQMTLDLVGQKDLIEGVSFSEFFETTKSMKLDKSAYNSHVDSIAEFKEMKSIIESVYSEKLHTVLGNMKHTTLNSSSFNELDQKIDNWIESLHLLQKRFEITEWIDLQKLTKEAIQCQIFENEYYKKYSALFQPNSKKQKKFIQLRKKYTRTKIELEQIQKENTHWKIVPSEVETKALIGLLKNSTFFSRIKTKKRWNEITHLPFEKAQEELQSHLSKIQQINNFTHLAIEFCELGVDNPEVDVEQIFNTINSVPPNEWEELATIPVEKRSKITASHHLLESLQRDLNTYFNIDTTSNVTAYLIQLKAVFGQLVANNKQYRMLSQNALSGIKHNADFNSFEREIYASHLSQFKNRFPNLAEFTMADLTSKIDEIIALQENEARLFSKMIEEQISRKFQEYHTLLVTSSRKLSEEEKELKARLRKGKSILVKEFSKTRSHPSLREIYNSEARVWIQLLKPIWLSNPAQLAKCFPMEAGLFDVAIFDEASQIPLQNALGAVQRSKRVIIAGDEHQMGPSSYFKSGTKEPMDLLHQANYHLQKVPLSHHYRSNHPDLIAFSNKHIYNDQLKAYPSFKSEKPIQHYFCEDGVFIKRQNEVEAKEIAKAIEARLGDKKTVGIVAFSEEQLNCIWNNLSAKTQDKLTSRIDDNTVFFKALENVQGDECDHLLISFGFSKNENDELHHRFGPMNTSNGRKRLNVLVTRAKETISFYCSIKSTDFKLSDNESVNLLRQWVQFSETYSESEHHHFPHQLNPIEKENTLIFKSIQNHLSSAKELVTLQNVLKRSGWKIEFN
jgi:superfamily I DNA and/or RNA helicase